MTQQRQTYTLTICIEREAIEKYFIGIPTTDQLINAIQEHNQVSGEVEATRIYNRFAEHKQNRLHLYTYCDFIELTYTWDNMYGDSCNVITLVRDTYTVNIIKGDIRLSYSTIDVPTALDIKTQFEREYLEIKMPSSLTDAIDAAMNNTELPNACFQVVESDGFIVYIEL